MVHRYRLKQQVRFAHHAASNVRLDRGDAWEVVRLLPFDVSGEPTYRVRSRAGERAVRESELEVASAVMD